MWLEGYDDGDDDGDNDGDNNTDEADMELVQNFTPPDFQVKNFTPAISPDFNSFSGKKHKKRVKMEKFTPLAKILHCDKFHLWL